MTIKKTSIKILNGKSEKSIWTQKVPLIKDNLVPKVGANPAITLKTNMSMALEIPGSNRVDFVAMIVDGKGAK